MTKPSILFIPGSFALPEFYDSVIEPVAKSGYEIKALHLPSVGLTAGIGRPGPAATMYDDAALIAREAEGLADEGKDVIIFAHSYGGIPMTESVKNLEKTFRLKEGKVGGVTRIAYMTALVPAVGCSAVDVLAGVPPEQRDSLQVDEAGWMFHDNIPASAALSFSDISQAEGESWLRKFPKHSAASFATPLSYAGYEQLPVSYLFCQHDLIIPANIQRDEIKMIEVRSGHVVHVTRIEAGHCPMAGQPQKVIDWITEVVGL